MTIKTIKFEIDRFLKSSDPEVMAIKGAWGVGKTYSWNKFLCEAENEKRIACDKYSYVSLFGLNSLDTFKNSIFEQIVTKKLIGTQANFETFKENYLPLFGSAGRKGLGWLRESSVLKGFGPAIQSLSFLSVNKILICIDDLERRGCSLSLKDVLGLVSFLKEQRNCKIVLLLNDGEPEPKPDEYKTYREKVIDIELQFVPTASECASIAFKKDDPDMELLAGFTQRLDIRNIRILKKIERLIGLVKPLLKNFDEAVLHQAIRSLALFSWCHYRTGDCIPTLDYVTNFSYNSWGIGGNWKLEEDEEHQQWKAVLINYGYWVTNGLDLVLAEAVRTGYFVEEDISREASKKHQEILAQQSVESFRQAWQWYHNSFNDNAAEVVEQLYAGFKKNVAVLTPIDLNGTVSLLRELEEEQKASELVDFYLEQKTDEPELFNLEASSLVHSNVRDPEIIEKFNVLYKGIIPVQTPIQIIARVVKQHNGWDPEDEEALAELSEEGYYEIFKSIDAPHLSVYVTTCLRFGRIQNATDQQKKIAENAIGALRKIGAESNINRLRIRQFGISLEKN